MTLPTPTHCRAEAFAAMRLALTRLNTTAGLIDAVIAVSMHELTDADPEAVREKLTELSTRVDQRIAGRDLSTILAHAHAVLFDEEKLRGNTEDYYNSHNSYLSRVLQTKVGLPITLTLIYKAVLEPLGVDVLGINAPGHFIAAVTETPPPDPDADTDPEPRRMLIDPFFEGQTLTRAEAFHRIEQAAGGAVAHDDELLQPATHREWLLRIIQNLVSGFDREQRRADLAAMLELRELVETKAPDPGDTPANPDRAENPGHPDRDDDAGDPEL